MNRQPAAGNLPVYFFYGNETSLIEEEVQKIKNTILNAGFSDLNYHVFSPKETEALEVVSVAMTVPAMSKKRLVLVKGVGVLKLEQQQVLADYMKDPSPTTCMILLAERGKIDKRSLLYREASRRGYVKVFNRLSFAQLTNLAMKEARDAGKEITKEAIEKLLSLTGNDLRGMRGELHKTILFVGEKTAIELNDIEEGVADVKENSIFDLADAIGQKDGRRAIRIFKKVSEEIPVKLLGAIIWQFRTLWKVKASIKKGVNKDRLPSVLGIPPYRVKGYIERSNKFTEDELSNIFHRLRVVDREMKGGGLPYPLSLERLIIDLCS
jgi:DNA polymerase-3 subunit delta